MRIGRITNIALLLVMMSGLAAQAEVPVVKELFDLTMDIGNGADVYTKILRAQQKKGLINKVLKRGEIKLLDKASDSLTLLAGNTSKIKNLVRDVLSRISGDKPEQLDESVQEMIVNVKDQFDVVKSLIDNDADFINPIMEMAKLRPYASDDQAISIFNKIIDGIETAKQAITDAMASESENKKAFLGALERSLNEVSIALSQKLSLLNQVKQANVLKFAAEIAK